MVDNDIKSKLDSIKSLDYSSFECIFFNVLNTHASIRSNNHELMTKPLQKVIMTFLVSFCNLNVKDLNDNIKFWKKNIPFFSDKSLSSSNVVLKEKANVITDKQK